MGTDARQVPTTGSSAVLLLIESMTLGFHPSNTLRSPTGEATEFRRPPRLRLSPPTADAVPKAGTGTASRTTLNLTNRNSKVPSQLVGIIDAILGSGPSSLVKSD